MNCQVRDWARGACGQGRSLTLEKGLRLRFLTSSLSHGLRANMHCPSSGVERPPRMRRIKSQHQRPTPVKADDGDLILRLNRQIETKPSTVHGNEHIPFVAPCSMTRNEGVMTGNTKTMATNYLALPRHRRMSCCHYICHITTTTGMQGRRRNS